MPSYHNALSDRLVICHFSSQSVFTVYNKDLAQKWQVVASNSELPTELKDSIFSETSLIRVGDQFTLAPLAEENYSPYFSINFGANHTIATQDSELFTVVYKNTDIAYANKLVGARLTTDVDVFYRYADQKNYPNALYFYQINDQVTILAWKDGKFMLANRYASDNEDELFYYVMLVVEQLELPAGDIHFSMVGSKEMHSNYHALFKNYLAPLHLSNEGTQIGSSEHEELANFMGTCVL